MRHDIKEHEAGWKQNYLLFRSGICCSNGSHSTLLFDTVKINQINFLVYSLSIADEFKVTQIIDNGQVVQLTLIENVSTEPISQKQMIIDNVSKKLDADTKEQVMPLLEAILQAQPTVSIKSYQQIQITIAMPRSRYEKMGRPQVGNIVEINLKRT